MKGSHRIQGKKCNGTCTYTNIIKPLLLEVYIAWELVRYADSAPNLLAFLSAFRSERHWSKSLSFSEPQFLHL